MYIIYYILYYMLYYIIYIIYRLINELAKFTFTIHYKPGKQNVIAGNLSGDMETCIHGDMHTNVMEACITATAPGQGNHILDAAEIQHQ